MYCDIPRLMRCCFCVPLRYGILLYGYLNLAFSTLLVAFLSYVCHTARYHPRVVVPVHGALLDTNHIAIPIILYCVEIIFNVILIVGLHKKLPKLLKIFYHYGLVATIGSFILFCVQFGMLTSQALNENDGFLLIEVPIIIIIVLLAVTGLILQGYLILLVRSELLKLERNQQFRFVNQAAEVVAETVAPEGGNKYRLI